MSQQFVLSLFPGVGLLDMAFEQEGFCVVRGPDVLWGGDIRRFHPPAGKFDGVIGGPPCKPFTKLAHMVKHKGYKPKHPNLIPEFERVVFEAKPRWWLMENVPDAPLPNIAGYSRFWSTLLNNRQCHDENGQPAVATRTRRWTFGCTLAIDSPVLMIDTAALESRDFLYCNGETATTRKRTKLGRMPWNHKGRQGFTESRLAQGLPDEWELPGFTVAASCEAVRQGVPLPMGRAIAKAVKEAVAPLPPPPSQQGETR